MSLETVYWSASIFFWLLFTGIGIPPVPEEAGILYAAVFSSAENAAKFMVSRKETG